MKEIKAPNHIDSFQNTIFLGGTIDMGNSVNWQKELKDYLNEHCPEYKDSIQLLNPRRDDWDSSWVQHKDNKEFNQQVTWELNALEQSSFRVFVFLPDSKSPITMLELGLFKHKASIVYCPFEFYRSGNIHIVCEKYNIPYYTEWDEFLNNFTNIINNNYAKVKSNI